MSRVAGCGLGRPRALRPHTPPPAIPPSAGRDPRRGPSAFARGRAAVSPTQLARPVPAGSGEIGHPGHRRIWTPSQRYRRNLWSRTVANGRVAVNSAPRASEPSRRSVRDPAGRVGGKSRPEGRQCHHAGASGPPTRLPAWGDGAAVSCRRRGPTRRQALSGRSRRRRESRPERDERAPPPSGQEKKSPATQWGKERRPATRGPKKPTRRAREALIGLTGRDPCRGPSGRETPSRSRPHLRRG
jgi:hypothetical protein